MFPKIITETLIEIEDLQKLLQTSKKTSGKLQKEEIKLYRKLLTLIRKKNKEIFSRFKKLGRVPSNDLDIKFLVEPLSEAIDDYAEIVIEGTADAVERGMRRAVTELNKMGFGEKSLKAKLDFDFIKDFSPEISKQIKEQTFVASQETINRLTGNVMDNLRESYEEGYGYNKAAERLKDVFTDMETYELERVARTEIASNENLGMFESEKELGVEYHKWRNARDENVRDSHEELEGQIVRVGEPFSNGLLYPGDRSGAIEEWIQCRCTLVPYILSEGMVAPDLPYFYEKDLMRLDHTDIADLSNASTSKLEKEYNKHKELFDEFERKETAPETKARVTDNLFQKLKDDDDFMRFMEDRYDYSGIREAYAQGLMSTVPKKDVISDLIHQWAITSSDTNELSLAMQLAIKKEFGLELAGTGHFHPTILVKAEKLLKEHEMALRKFVRAQYEITQEYLKANKIADMTLYRGFAYSNNSTFKPKNYSFDSSKLTSNIDKINLQPISSFSYDPDKARFFARYEDNSMIIQGKVKAENIFSTSQTGFGCKSEAEIVILGGDGKFKVLTCQNDVLGDYIGTIHKEFAKIKE